MHVAYKIVIYWNENHLFDCVLKASFNFSMSCLYREVEAWQWTASLLALYIDNIKKEEKIGLRPYLSSVNFSAHHHHLCLISK